jgi:hypothetical protein
MEAPEDFESSKRILGGGMSRDLSPAELCVCRIVFGFLAVMVFGFLVLKGIDSLFDHRSGPVSKVEVQPDTRTSIVRNPKYPKPSENLDPQPQKVSAAEPDQPERVFLSIMKVRLERLGAVGLEKMVWFDPQPLERRVDAQSLGLAEIGPQPILTESFQASQERRIVIASASPEDPLLTPPQELKASQPEGTAPRSKVEEASATVESLTEEQVLHIKSRLHDLGFLSFAKSDKWDAGARNALRDFKVANSLPNDYTWDLETSNKLNSETAVRADHSIIGDWSTAPCRSAKPTDTRLSISSGRSKSSAGGVCDFHDLKVTAREWRVKATCSQGDKRWTATGKFSLTADKLVWTSERDVINYFRCR